jgi:hypothetical protein
MMCGGYHSVHHFFTCDFTNTVHSSATPELSHSRWMNKRPFCGALSDGIAHNFFLHPLSMMVIIYHV